jgi:hypothetical protein
MTWLTWRQFRAQALTGLGAAAALAAYVVVLGLRIRHTADPSRDALRHDYFTSLLLSGFLVVLVPALVGAFWGAPLIARELETGTHRLVWHQSVTRVRWLAVKLGLVTVAGVALTGALAMVLTWAASPYDKVVAGRFDPLVFPARDVAPLGYAVFAVVAGTAIGLLTRRTVPAIAVTLAAFAALQILLPTTIRPYLRPAVTETVAYNADSADQGARINIKGGVAKIEGYAKPGAWVLSTSAELLDATGRPIAGTQCSSADRERDDACYIAKHAHFTVAYQPADRYWTFQWLEVATYLVLAGLLAGFAFWRLATGSLA